MVYSPFKTSQDPAISPSDCTERSCTTHCQTSPLLPYLLLHQGTSPFVLYAPWIGGSVLSLGLGQPWPCLDLAVIAPSLWNRLPPSARASLLSSNLSTSLSLLKTCLFSWS